MWVWRAQLFRSDAGQILKLLGDKECDRVSFERFAGQFCVWKIYNNIRPIPTPAVKIFSVTESRKATGWPLFLKYRVPKDIFNSN